MLRFPVNTGSDMVKTGRNGASLFHTRGLTVLTEKQCYRIGSQGSIHTQKHRRLLLNLAVGAPGCCVENATSATLVGNVGKRGIDSGQEAEKCGGISWNRNLRGNWNQNLKKNEIKNWPPWPWRHRRSSQPHSRPCLPPECESCRSCGRILSCLPLP